MSPTTRDAKKQAKTRQRRRHTAHERLRHDQQQAQQAIKALEQALDALGLPDNLVKEIEGRLRRQQKVLGTIFGVMFPSLFGCRTPSERARVRGWDKNVPPQRLGALPKRSWLKRLRRLGLEVLVPLWRQVQNKSAATHSRWQWTWVVDDAVCKKYGQQLGWVGTWWSGQDKRLRPGMDGVLLLVVIGDGTLVVPVDCAIRRPDPTGPGRPGRDKRRWVQGMLDERLAALGRHGLQLPPPVVVAESWLSDAKWMGHVSRTHQGTRLVEGKSSSVLVLSDGQQVKGAALLHGAVWSWREHPGEPRVRYARVRATSPTYGAVTVVIVGRTGPRSLLSAVFGDHAECPAADPAVATAHLDCVCLSDAEAPVGDRSRPGTQRRCVLWAFGVAPHGVLRPVLYRSRGLQGADDHGRDRIESQTLLALCGFRSLGVTRTFMGS